MVYKGGYYFDTDCDEFPDLNKQADQKPTMGFWQLRDPTVEFEIFEESPHLLPYCFPAALSFNPIYIFAIADIKRLFNQYGESIFKDNDAANPLLINGNKNQLNAVIMLTGIAIYRAIMIHLTLTNTNWKNFMDLIIFPDSKNVGHAGGSKYIDGRYNDELDSQRTDLIQALLDKTSNEFETEKIGSDYWQNLYAQFVKILPNDLVEILSKNYPQYNLIPVAHSFSFELESVGFSTKLGTHVTLISTSEFFNWISNLPLETCVGFGGYEVYKTRDNIVCFNEGAGTPGIQIKKLGADVFIACNNLTADKQFKSSITDYLLGKQHLVNLLNKIDSALVSGCPVEHHQIQKADEEESRNENCSIQ
ncbi:MAG: hypothetical protein H0U73_12835 [Tatlockia sp.]|nr:hypothetical protein [Tatlockia sp.]